MAPTGHDSVWHELMRVPFEQGWLKAGDVDTRFWRAGPRDAPAVVLLHGTGGHVEGFVRNLGALAQSYDTWAIDMRGHGWSTLATEDLEIADYCEHLLAFLDAQGLDRVVLGGVSLGGWVATRMAIAHPERVSALILITPGGSQADPRVMSTIKTSTSAAVDELTWDSVRARLEYLVHDPSSMPDDMVSTRMAIYGRPGMSAGMKHILALQEPAIRARNLIRPEEYAAIDCPTLVVWTAHDPTASTAEGRRIASMIPGAQFELLEDCAHWAQFEAPDLFNQLSTIFLEAALDVTQPA